MEQGTQVAGVNLKIRAVSQMSEAKFQIGSMDVFDLGNVKLSRLKMGKVSAMAGHAAFEAIRKVIELALDKKVQATVTGPIHKEALNKAGHHFSGHTEIYAHYTHTTRYAMLLVHGSMRVIHVSTHVSLREACDLVKKKRIIEVIYLLDQACKQFGIKIPRIGVAGLNPHASDGGLFGQEEKNEILPAVTETHKKGYHVEGPIPADTLFTKAKGGLYDGCVAMYHDQGHIPFKLEGFTWDPESGKMQSVKGVNITVGLPIIRTSVDHGTAFEIAGKGIASPDALQLAVEYAATMAQNSLQK
jgi:4-hydroxythreonine-4-phosphate dehydrogenase